MATEKMVAIFFLVKIQMNELLLLKTSLWDMSKVYKFENSGNS